MRIYEPKREGLIGGWRKLYNEELHNLYSSPIRKDEMVRACTLHRRDENYSILVRKHEGKRQFGKPQKAVSQSWTVKLNTHLQNAKEVFTTGVGKYSCTSNVDLSCKIIL